MSIVDIPLTSEEELAPALSRYKSYWGGYLQQGQFQREEVIADNGMVVCAHPLAARAGVAALEKGGNAVDAAVATAFALGVVEPFMCGVGGGGVMVLRVAKTGEVCIISFRERAPLGVKQGMFEMVPGEGDVFPSEGLKAALVPGMVAGFSLAHKKYGKLGWEDLLEPATALAEKGFLADRYVATGIASESDSMQRFPELARIFTRDDLPPVSANATMGYGLPAIIIQEDLARTLRRIAKEGPDGFYKGEIAETIDKYMRENGGLISKEDLANYQPIVVPPRPAEYRGYEIIHAPGTGGSTMVQTLNILEGYDLTKPGWNSAQYIHLFAEAFRLAMLDAGEHACGFADRMPLDKLESKEYAAELRRQINPERASSESGKSPASFEGETTNFTVVDKDRNAVACTFSLGRLFGSKVVIPGTGIILNDHINAFCPFPGTLNSLEPGKPYYHGRNPCLVVKEGKLYAGLGSPSYLLPNTIEVLLNILDFGMGIQEAIDAPRMGCGSAFTGGKRAYAGTLVLDFRIPEEVCRALQEMGHKVVLVDPQLSFATFARPSGFLIDIESGKIHGGNHLIVFPYGIALGY